jgi:hypothetical protein
MSAVIEASRRAFATEWLAMRRQGIEDGCFVDKKNRLQAGFGKAKPASKPGTGRFGRGRGLQ